MEEVKHFSREDFFYMFFGAFFIGLVFVLSRNFIEVSKAMTMNNVLAVIALTSILATIEVYYVGYTRVTEKAKRPFSEFWAKRFISVYLVSIITSLIIIYIYGVDKLLGPQNVLKGVIAASMPCSLGAVLSDLVKKIKF